MTMLVLALACLAVMLYVYVGYPVLMWALVRIRGAKPVRADEQYRPTVTLVISAFNEAPVIRAKILNALELDYPAELLDIVVVSDASDDGTDAIVEGIGLSRVKLWRQAARMGKTAGLNAVMPNLTSEIVVFSDANAIYERTAVSALVRNFADPDVGCAVGEARYTQDTRSAAGRGENAYWSYEIRLKRMESAWGSMVGGDGAIYAIRRRLWRTLPTNTINDFLNPLQIVDAGYRAVYEGAAICYEEPADNVRREVQRRIRIVSRSWAAIFLVPSVLNPFRTGLFAFSLISHKVLRWFSALWLAGIVVGAAATTISWLLAHETPVLLTAFIVGAGALMLPPTRRLLAVGTYFFLVQAASMVGVVKGTVGATSGVWTPPRHTAESSSHPEALHPLAVVPVAVVGLVALAAALTAGPFAGVKGVFWTSIALIAYSYFVYPLILAVLLTRAGSRTHRAPYTPTLALLITANDEAEIIEAKLRNSLACRYPDGRLHIVVASDGSVDATNAIVRRYADRGITLLAYPQRLGKMAAINAAMRELTAEVVVLTDANVMVEPDALLQLASAFVDPTVGAASADVVLQGERASLAWSEDLYYRYERWLQRAESVLGSMIGVDGGLFAVRRAAYVAPPDSTVLDDVAIPMEIARQGYRVVMVAEAKAFEEGSLSTSQEFGRKARIAAGAVQFLRMRCSRVGADHPQLLAALFSHKVMRWLSPLLAIIAVLSGMVLAGESPLYASMMVAVGFVGSAAVLGLHAGLRRFPPIGLGYYFCLMQAATLVGLVRGIAGRQPAAWQRFARVA